MHKNPHLFSIHFYKNLTQTQQDTIRPSTESFVVHISVTLLPKLSHASPAEVDWFILGFIQNGDEISFVESSCDRRALVQPWKTTRWWCNSSEGRRRIHCVGGLIVTMEIRTKILEVDHEREQIYVKWLINKIKQNLFFTHSDI